MIGDMSQCIQRCGAERHDQTWIYSVDLLLEEWRAILDRHLWGRLIITIVIRGIAENRIGDEDFRSPQAC